MKIHRSQHLRRMLCVASFVALPLLASQVDAASTKEALGAAASTVGVRNVSTSSVGGAPIVITPDVNCKKLLNWLTSGVNYLAPFYDQKTLYWLRHC